MSNHLSMYTLLPPVNSDPYLRRTDSTKPDLSANPYSHLQCHMTSKKSIFESEDKIRLLFEIEHKIGGDPSISGFGGHIHIIARKMK